MSLRDDVLNKHRDEIRAAAHRYRVESIALVGSVARNEDGGCSDFDFLARFADGASLFDLIGLKEELEELLGRDVDVISERGLKPRHRRILGEPVAL